MVADKRNEPLPESIVFVLQSRQLVHPMRFSFCKHRADWRDPRPCSVWDSGWREDGWGERGLEKSMIVLPDL